MIRHLGFVSSLIVSPLSCFFKCPDYLLFRLQPYIVKSMSLEGMQIEFFLLFNLLAPWHFSLLDLNIPFYSFQKLSLSINPCLVGITQSTGVTNTPFLPYPQGDNQLVEKIGKRTAKDRGHINCLEEPSGKEGNKWASASSFFPFSLRNNWHTLL